MVTEKFAGLTALKVDLVSGTKVLQSFSAPVADLDAGYQFNSGKVPFGAKDTLKLVYTPTGTATAGSVEAGLIFGRTVGSMAT
jgi:hypothetical protein